MPNITINITEDAKKALTKRAKKNFRSLKEEVEDIVRRSAANSINKTTRSRIKIDDKLVAAFSRDKRGRPRKK